MAKSQKNTKKEKLQRQSKSSAFRVAPNFKEQMSVLGKIKLPKVKMMVKPILRGIVASLASVFFVIWIAIGLFVGILMIQSFRHGVFNTVLFGPTAADNSQAQSQAPKEANLPGVGRVDVSCVRAAMSQQSIQKLVESQNMSVLSADEKAKLDPCIVQKEATPSETPGK